jgi:hypothetical protein
LTLPSDVPCRVLGGLPDGVDEKVASEEVALLLAKAFLPRFWTRTGVACAARGSLPGGVVDEFLLLLVQVASEENQQQSKWIQHQAHCVSVAR